jgi:hypothetical protein
MQERVDLVDVDTVVVVPVLIRVLTDETVVVFPDPVTVFQGEKLEWIAEEGRFVVEFKVADGKPFGQNRYESDGNGRRRVGPHNIGGDVPTTHEYGLTATIGTSVFTVDPTVEADPRTRPERDKPNR